MSNTPTELRKTGISVVNIETAAVQALEARINGDFRHGLSTHAGLQRPHRGDRHG